MPGPAHPSQTDPPPEDPAGRWDPFLNALADSLPFASAILSKGRLQKISNSDIVVELNGTAFDRGRIESKRMEIESVCQDFFGKPLHLTLIGDCAPKEYGNDEKSPARLRQEILNHPLVADAIKRFNGTVVDVKLNPRSNP
jgi:DNA polymerase-3 subunit gamma/tau